MASFGRARLAAAVALGLVLLGLTAAVPAHADPPPPAQPLPPGTEWVPARCATGAVDEYALDSIAGSTYLRLSGWIHPCAEGSPNGFVVIRYYADQGMRNAPAAYASLDAPTAFQLVVPLSRSATRGALTAVCVAFAENGRVACFRLDPGGQGEVSTVAPISTDDPRVRVRVGAAPVAGTDPTCGTCV